MFESPFCVSTSAATLDGLPIQNAVPTTPLTPAPNSPSVSSLYSPGAPDLRISHYEAKLAKSVPLVDGKYNCPVEKCPSRFRERRNLVDHLKRVHTKSNIKVREFLFLPCIVDGDY